MTILWLIMGASICESQRSRLRHPSPPAEVQRRPLHNSLIGIQYEQWFYGPKSWKTAEAEPILGHYTTSQQIVAKHFADFGKLGIDWLLIDWSNMLWANPAWEQHTGETKNLEDKTRILFDTAHVQLQQGKYAPKLVFMIGLQNGPPVVSGVNRLNAEIAWIEKYYLDQPEYKNLWLMVNNKPLLTILYWPRDPCAQLSKDLAATPLHAERWTVRWMSSQLQDNHANRCGMWSWMDGTIPQVLTKCGHIPEEIVVTPAAFRLPAYGWTDSTAISRDNGKPYIESWKAAFAARPRFIQIHQWNEFAGQEDGRGLPKDYWKHAETAQHSNIYADEYSVPLSDDIEPTSLTGCGFRGCGGWGYYYFNLTRAIISLYRGLTPDITVLALSGPSTALKKGEGKAELSWSYLGRPPSAYVLKVDGITIADQLHGQRYELDTSRFPPGVHKVELVALGSHTLFDLDPRHRTTLSRTPLEVSSTIALNIKAPKQKNH